MFFDKNFWATVEKELFFGTEMHFMSNFHWRLSALFNKKFKLAFWDWRGEPLLGTRERYILVKRIMKRMKRLNQLSEMTSVSLAWQTSSKCWWKCVTKFDNPSVSRSRCFTNKKSFFLMISQPWTLKTSPTASMAIKMTHARICVWKGKKITENFAATFWETFLWRQFSSSPESIDSVDGFFLFFLSNYSTEKKIRKKNVSRTVKQGVHIEWTWV